MASPELQRLWKLAQVDQTIDSIKKRAASLDVGQKIAAEIGRLDAEFQILSSNAKSLRSELTELELIQQGLDQKLKKIDGELYGGKVVSSREVENLEKEVAQIKRQRGSHDDRILELWELVPPAEKAADALKSQLDKQKVLLVERRKLAVVEKEHLQSEFKRLSTARGPLAAAVGNPSLLGRYDSIRQRHDTGMAEVTKTNHCGACGTHLPERTIETLKDDKMAACESCHRLLYYTDGLI